jgi:hypothetical protein
MDADDISLPERLIWEVEFMENYPQVVVGGAVKWVDVTGKFLHSPWVTLHPPIGNCEIESDLVEYNPFWQSSVLMRTEAFVRAGGYRGAFALAVDYDIWLRIAEHFEMANLKQVVPKYRIHPHQVSVLKYKQQNLSGLAALASAAPRRNGSSDPLNSFEEVTPAVPVELGVCEAKQQAVLAIGWRGWIHSMCAAGEWPGALKAAIEILKSSDWKSVERRTLADMQLEVAQLYWKSKRLLMSIITAGRAVLTLPMLVERPQKPLLQRLGLVLFEFGFHVWPTGRLRRNGA